MPRRKLIKVELSDLTGCIGAVIVPARTGVIYTNQVGGYACNHPELEGYCIPIGVERRILDVTFSSDLGPYKGHCYEGMAEQEAKALNRYLPPETVIDLSRIKEAQEAWLPVLYRGQQAILTWENSD